MTSQYDVRLIFAMEIAAAGDKQAFLFRGFQIMQCLLPAVVGRKYFNAVNLLLRDLIQQFIISAQILPRMRKNRRTTRAVYQGRSIRKG